MNSLKGSLGPLSSIRLENYRDGVEDFELLHMLRKQINAGADASSGAGSWPGASAGAHVSTVGGAEEEEGQPAVRKVVGEVILGFRPSSSPLGGGVNITSDVSLATGFERTRRAVAAAVVNLSMVGER